MCGIFGWFGAGPTSPQHQFELLSHLLQHRGPNDQGFEYADGWALGFRRLSILDLSPAGHQPMAAGDGRFWIVFNGEIYNYRELRRDLEIAGEHFTGTSDTEVLLRLLAREGVAALPKLNGMFALAFIDIQKRTFLLARDRLGVKPLYYCTQNGQLRFASELKALLAWPDAQRTLNPNAAAEYLALNYLPAETCIFTGYTKLLPGHVLYGQLDTPVAGRISPYWQLSIGAEDTDARIHDVDLDELLSLLEDAVRIRLRSDVPVGVFLSGGLDSGIVAALSSRVAGNNRPLALTVSFAERDYDESGLARTTASHAGLEHRVIAQRPPSLNDLDRLAWFFDEPFGDASALPTFALCEAAARHATVFLSGDGGDEAFGGYRRYIESQRYRWLLNLPPVAANMLRSASNSLPEYGLLRYRLHKTGAPDARFAAAFDGMPDDPVLWSVLTTDMQPLLAQAAQPLWSRWARTAGRALVARQQALDYALYLPDDILVKADRASMAHSIEVRSPFLDYRLVEWAARLPRASLLNSQQGKLPLRALAARLLPGVVGGASKRGFGIPLDAWFRAPQGQLLARERLLSSEALHRGLWSRQGVEQILALHATGRGRDFGPLIWRLLFFDAWARQYLDSQAFLDGPAVATTV